MTAQEKKSGKAGTPALVTLQKLGVVYGVHPYDHDPAAPSFGIEAAEALGVDAARVFKTLMADVDGHPAVAIVPVTGSLDLKSLATAAGGKRAKMLAVAAAERLTGYVVGGISPIGQRTVSPTYLDQSALDHVTIFVSGGRRGLDIEIAPRDLVTVTGARLASIASG